MNTDLHVVGIDQQAVGFEMQMVVEGADLVVDDKRLQDVHTDLHVEDKVLQMVGTDLQVELKYNYVATELLFKYQLLYCLLSLLLPITTMATIS